MKEFEYLLVQTSYYPDIGERQNKMDDLGAEGWEFVAVDADYLYFKKEITPRWK